MSGGSYDYLCSQEALDPEQLGRMANRLHHLGFYSLAEATRDKIVSPDDPLRKAWKAVEWLDSFDWSTRQTVRELEAVETAMTSTPTGGDG